jgi:hypothetical protein
MKTKLIRYSVKLFVLCIFLVVGINVLLVDKTRMVVLNYTMNDSTHEIIGKDLIKDKSTICDFHSYDMAAEKCIREVNQIAGAAGRDKFLSSPSVPRMKPCHEG